MRPALSDLHGRSYDVVVVGGGINGTATAHRLSAAGYDVLLIDRADFGSGSSGRSSRIMHCGLNYLAAALDARGLRAKLSNVALARKMMRERARLLASMPERIRAQTFYIPIRSGDPIGPRQHDVAFHALNLLSGWDSTLRYRRYRRPELGGLGIARYFGDRLVGLASFEEYVFDWPERICVDFALAAAETGATIRNYTALAEARSTDGTWRISLRDTLTGGDTAEVGARLLANLAGPLADTVSAACGIAGRPTVTPNKGCHIAVRLPAEFRDAGLISRNGLGHLFLCVPWKDFHILGPTETIVDRPVEAVTADDGDVRSLLDQANAVMPALRLTEDDVLFRWAGLRPATFDAANPRGTWKRTIYDHATGDGAPLVSMSWGRLADHAFTAEDVLARTQRHLGARAGRDRRSAADRAATGADAARTLDHIVRTEAPASIEDILFRRTGSGWSADLGLSEAGRAAEALARAAGGPRPGAAIDGYRAFLEKAFSYRAE